MVKILMSYLFSYSKYQTECAIKFLLRQLMTLYTLRFIFDCHLKQWPTWRKRGDEGSAIKLEYLKNEKCFLNAIKSIFHSFQRAIMWWKNKKIPDTSFNDFKIHFSNKLLSRAWKTPCENWKLVNLKVFCFNICIIKLRMFSLLHLKCQH